MGSVEEAPVWHSAVADHLQKPRIVPARCPVGHKPPFPTYVSRFPGSVKDIVMAIFGAQHANAQKAKEAGALTKIVSFLDKGPENSAPKRRDLASVTDKMGAYNEVVIAYWDSIETFQHWKEASGFEAWWKGLDPTAESHGWFQEVFLPSIDRYENVYASKRDQGWTPEGAGAFSAHISGQITEFGYWGSMRDRIPQSQVDELVGEKKKQQQEEQTAAAVTSPHQHEDTTKARIRVPGKKNLAVIRSGQDWSRTLPDEYKLYTETLHPVLVQGMNYLRDEGGQIGCYSCRLMDVLDPSTQDLGTKQTFGLAYFDDLTSMEKWSEHHPTHLQIYHGFLKYVKDLKGQVTLHLWHEVLVLEPEQQYFEYIGCHPKTGLLES